MQLTEPLFSVQSICHNAHTFEVVDDVSFDAFQTGLCRPQTVCIDAKGQILGLNQTVVTLGKLILQHRCIFLTNGIEIVALGRNCNTAGEAIFRCSKVQERQLELNRTVKVIQEVTPALKNSGFILILAELVVNILELDSFGIVIVAHTADTVRPHSLIRDAVLGGLFFLAGAVCPGNRSFNFLTLASCQLALGLCLLNCFVLCVGLALFLFREQC